MTKSVINSELEKKIEHSIALISKAEKLALAMSEDGFFVAFSGGKDSQVVLELVKLAGVRYKAFYNVTTNDPPANVRFIRQHYPEVVFDMPKKSFMQLVAEKGLPTMCSRYCCAILKESKGTGHVVITGVRADESKKRANYQEFSQFGKKEKKDIDLTAMEEAKFKCVGGRDKFMLYPILQWTTKDIWQFIREREIPVNPCYETRKRVGCIFCPFAPKYEILSAIQERPKAYQALLHSLQKFIAKRKSDKNQFDTAEEYFYWWLSKENIKSYKEKQNQLKLF